MVNATGGARRMSRRIHDKVTTFGAARVTGLLGLTLLGTIGTSAEAYADMEDDRWQIDVPVYLAANTFYQKNDGGTDTFGTLSASVEIELWSHTSPWSGSLFIDHHTSSDSRVDGTIAVGGLLQYRFHNWDTTAALLRDKSPRAPGVWIYSGRVRYEFAARHKLGIEAIGSFGSPESSKLAIGYYGTISPNFSVKFLVGSGVNSGHERVARAELAWQIH